MKVRFDNFEEIIRTALKNKLSLEAKLIIVGRISYAREVGELTLKEAKELEDMLGGRSQWQDAYEVALAGATDSDKYQLAS
jgi:thiazole synthase